MKLGDFESYKENPIKIEGYSQKTISSKEEGILELVAPETGEITYAQKIGTSKVISHDALPYKKIFDKSLPEVMSLSSSGLRVWCYLLSELKPRQDYVTLNLEDCKSFTSYSSNVAVYKGLIELLDKKFIFKKVGAASTYFININYFYNGKRV